MSFSIGTPYQMLSTKPHVGIMTSIRSLRNGFSRWSTSSLCFLFQTCIDTKEEFSGENVLKKGERAYTQGLDVYEKSQSLLAACHRIYRKLADEIHEIKIVDCVDREGRLRSVEAIGAEVLAIVEGHGL